MKMMLKRVWKVRYMIRKYEFYPEFQDLFEYDGNNEIELVRIKGGRSIRRDWFVFGSMDEALIFFNGPITNKKAYSVTGSVTGL